MSVFGSIRNAAFVAGGTLGVTSPWRVARPDDAPLIQSMFEETPGYEDWSAKDLLAYSSANGHYIFLYLNKAVMWYRHQKHNRYNTPYVMGVAKRSTVNWSAIATKGRAKIASESARIKRALWRSRPLPHVTISLPG